MVFWATVTEQWEIEVAYPHIVRVEHNQFSGRVILLPDDGEVFRRTLNFWDAGYEHRVAVDGTECVLRIAAKAWSAEYRPSVGDKPQ